MSTLTRQQIADRLDTIRAVATDPTLDDTTALESAAYRLGELGREVQQALTPRCPAPADVRL